jgi:hypothetical protein
LEAVGIVTGSGDKLGNVAMWIHCGGRSTCLESQFHLFLYLLRSLLRNGCYLSKGAKFCFLKNGGRQEVRSARRRGERDRSVESLVLADR